MERCELYFGLGLLILCVLYFFAMKRHHCALQKIREKNDEIIKQNLKVIPTLCDADLKRRRDEYLVTLDHDGSDENKKSNRKMFDALEAEIAERQRRNGSI